MGCGASKAHATPGTGAAMAEPAAPTPGTGAVKAEPPPATPAEPAAADNTASPTLQLPANLDEVDAAFVASALSGQGFVEPGTRIVSFEKVKFGREKGYLGDKCLLKDIVYDPPAGKKSRAPGSIFVKLFPTDLIVQLPAVVGMWNTEVDVVTRVLKELPDASDFQVPHFYFAERRDAEEEGKPPCFAILMEPIEGAKPCDILSSMPVEHAIRAAKDLAILHAPYWGLTHAGYRENPKLSSFGHMEDPGGEQRLQGVFKMGSSMGPPVFGGPLSAEQLEDFSGYVEFWGFFGTEIWPLLQTRWAAVTARWKSIPAALIHGDLHVENMFCLEDGSNVYIDFQAVNLGPCTRDLAYLLASSLKSEDRHEHEEAIVRTYHEALLARLGEGRAQDFAWEQCWADFVFMKIHGLYAAMLGAGIFAAKNFKEKSGIFAAEPSDDAIQERTRNNLLFRRVVDDMRHSAWAEMLQALPEDAPASDDHADQ